MSEKEFMAEAEADGTMDWMRGVTPDVQESPEAEAPEPEAEAPDTEAALDVDEPEATEGTVPEEEEASTPEPELKTDGQSDDQKEDEVSSEDGVYEFDADHPFFTKYGGDPDKALKALEESQSLIGRQANEVGEARKAQEEMAARLARIEEGMQSNRPYQAQWPGEDLEEDVQAEMYSRLANEAYERKDAETFGQAVEAWKEIDPFGASNLVNEVRIQQALAAQTAPPQESLEDEMGKVLAEYPDAPQLAEQVGAESQKYPTLRMLMESGNSLEKAQAFKELYLIVRNRQDGVTSADAKKKVAVRISEEARKARQDAQVASGGKAAVASPVISPQQKVFDDAFRRYGSE